MLTIETRRQWRRWAKYSYNLVRTFVRLYYIERRNPIFVYQMGKVGSSTVARTLERLRLSAPVLQVHILSSLEYQRAIVRQRELGVRYPDEHLIISRFLVRKLQRGVFPCRIITLTREPISRAISFAFETLRTRNADVILPDGRIDREKMTRKIIQLLDSDHPAADPGKWFEAELRAVFGIDVFSQPYEFDTGYKIFPHNRTPTLVIRMEDINRHLHDALGTFLGLQIGQNQLCRANIGDQKWYSDDIAWVKRNLQVPRETLLRVLNTRYFHHFYVHDRESILRKYQRTDMAGLSTP